MTLILDARQRAMLQEMGITVWGKAPAPAVPATFAAPPAEVAPRPSSSPAVDAIAAIAAPAALDVAAPASRAPITPPAPAARPAAPVQPAEQRGGARSPAVHVHAPVALYAGADPAQTPQDLGAGWLVITESSTPAAPLSGDAGRLLDNMLRALRLHQHPRVHLLALQRVDGAHLAPATSSETLPEATSDVPAAALQQVQALQSSVVLILGHVAARAVLGSSQPLGLLRATPHQLGNTPAVVTYDPAFLLRSPQSKAAAWADLCSARALLQAPKS